MPRVAGRIICLNTFNKNVNGFFKPNFTLHVTVSRLCADCFKFLLDVLTQYSDVN